MQTFRRWFNWVERIFLVHNDLLDRKRWWSWIILILEQVVELGDIGDDAELVRCVRVQHVLGVQQTWNTKLLFCNFVGKIIVVKDVFLLQRIIVNQLRPAKYFLDPIGVLVYFMIKPEMMDHGTERKSISPANVHVNDVDIIIRWCHSATPNLRRSYFNFTLWNFLLMKFSGRWKHKMFLSSKTFLGWQWTSKSEIYFCLWIILKGWQIGIEYFRLCSLGMCWMLSSSSTASHRSWVLCHKIRIVIVFHWSWLICVKLTSNALTPFLSTSGIFLVFYISHSSLESVLVKPSFLELF